MLLDIPLTNVRSRVLLLRTRAFLEKMAPEDILLAAENSRARHFRKGETVPMVRGTERLLYIVVSGQLHVRSGTGESYVNAPEGMGWFEALADAEPSTVTATEETRVLELSADFILGALEDNYSLWRSMVRGNAQYILDLRGGLPRADHEQTHDEIAAAPALLQEDSLVTRLRYFQDGPLDQGSLDAAIAVARSMQRVKFQPQEEIFALGDTSRWWITILQGTVECSNDKESTLIQAEYMLGVLDAVAERPRSYRAVAKTDVVAYRIGYEAWASVLETHTDLALGVLRLTSEMALRLSTAR